MEVSMGVSYPKVFKIMRDIASLDNKGTTIC